MRVFVAVAERGSFVEAARRLRLSPAAITRAVAQLEDHLGLSLLHRTTRAVRLSERGALYLDHCRRVLDDIADAERAVRGEDAAPRGTLTVAAPLMFGRLHVLPVLARLLREHRDLAARLLLSDRVVHLVEEGVDAAVRIGEPADSALIAVKVGAVRRVLVASPGYLAAHGTPQAPADLAGHDLVAFEGVNFTSEWRFGDARALTLRIEPRLAVNSADAAIAAAEAGLGITRTLSYQVHEAVQAGRLRLVLDRFAPPAVPVQVMYPSQRRGAANVTAFMHAARAHFAMLPMLAAGG